MIRYLLRKSPSHQKIQVRTFVVEKASKTHRKGIETLLEEVFFKQEPTCVMSGVAQKTRPSYPLAELALSGLQEGRSFVARPDPGDPRVIGVSINVKRPKLPHPSLFRDTLEALVCEKEKILLHFWQHVAAMPGLGLGREEGDEVEKEEDTHDGVRPQDVFDIRFLAVHPASQRKGVAKNLIQESRFLAEDLGFKNLRIDCFNAHTSKIAEGLGMKCIYKMQYANYKNERGEPVFLDCAYPHFGVHVFIDSLNQEEPEV